MYAHEMSRMLAAQMRDQRVPRQELGEVCCHPDRSHPGTSSTVRDAKRFVQVHVTDVRAHVGGPAKTDLRIQVGAVQVNLPAVLVHDGADSFDFLLEDPVGGRVGHHERREPLRMRRGLGREIDEIDVPFLVARHHDDAHTGHCRRSGVGPVGACRDETHVALVCSATLVKCPDDEQTR
jgi:hypothetical protein